MSCGPHGRHWERRAEVERVRGAINEIAHSGLTLSKLSVAASLLGDLVRGEPVKG